MILNPDKMEVLLVGTRSDPGNGLFLVLDGVVLPSRKSRFAAWG